MRARIDAAGLSGIEPDAVPVCARVYENVGDSSEVHAIQLARADRTAHGSDERTARRWVGWQLRLELLDVLG